MLEKLNKLSALAKRNRQSVFLTFLKFFVCRFKYKVSFKQFEDKSVYKLKGNEYKLVCRECKEETIKRKKWVKRYTDTYKFLHKWGSLKWNHTWKGRHKRWQAYTKFYNMGEHCMVEYDVEISRKHFLDGTLTVGNNVSFAKHVLVDYSGDLIIGNNVGIADGAYILTHDHKHQHNAITKIEAEGAGDNDIKGHLEICDGVVIGAKAVILSTCHRIGKFARISAGAFVTKDVPDYAVVMPTAPVIINKGAMDNIQAENVKGSLNENAEISVIAEIKEKLLNLLQDDLPNIDFTQSDLVESGVLDSLTLVEIISLITQNFSVEISFEEIVPENFSSIMTIAELINKHLN